MKGEYIIYVKLSDDKQRTVYTMARHPRWYEKFARRWGLSKATWTVKVIDTWEEKVKDGLDYEEDNPRGGKVHI